MLPPSEYEKICFVIMPFGKKPVGDVTIDFDAIYRSIFEPAITATPLPEGGRLISRRADSDFFAGHIDLEMFHYLEYSRVALADITGLNANVFYELGARHRARERGTVVLRQAGAPIPFDITKVKAFSYEHEPDDKAAESLELITKVLETSLEQNRLDSPVHVALRVQHEHHADTEHLLREAENALRSYDLLAACQSYRAAVDVDDRNPLLRVKLGLVLKDLGNWTEAHAQFDAAVRLSPSYAEAHREKGIAESKLADGLGLEAAASGEASLRTAIELNPEDFDALASLAGIFKRRGDFAAAQEFYRRASEVSGGHAYPLLNEITLHARLRGELAVDQGRRFLLSRAERSLRQQVKQDPPYDAPWSFFDLSKIRLFQGDREAFLDFLEEGLLHCDHAWQAETLRDTLSILADGGVELPGLLEGLNVLEDRIAYLPRGGAVP